MSDTSQDTVDAVDAAAGATVADAPLDSVVEPAQAAQSAPDAPVAAPDSAPVEASAVALTAAQVDERIARWFDSQIRNSPIARSTEAWNYLIASTVTLRDFIMTEA